MRKFFLLAVCTISVLIMYAQTSDAEAEAIVNLLGVQKKEAISRLITVAPKDSVVFWKLYDEYQRKSASVAKTRIRLYEATAMAYQGMVPKVADSLAMKFFDNRIFQEKTLEEYYQKIKSATNAVTAFEFYQAEVYILTQVRAHIMQQIPTYGEFKRDMKDSKNNK
jgi:hypothetical protein